MSGLVLACCTVGDDWGTSRSAVNTSCHNGLYLAACHLLIYQRQQLWVDSVWSGWTWGEGACHAGHYHTSISGTRSQQPLSEGASATSAACIKLRASRALAQLRTPRTHTDLPSCVRAICELPTLGVYSSTQCRPGTYAG